LGRFDPHPHAEIAIDPPLVRLTTWEWYNVRLIEIDDAKLDLLIERRSRDEAPTTRPAEELEHTPQGAAPSNGDASFRFRNPTPVHDWQLSAGHRRQQPQVRKAGATRFI
jgi:hypothetical protein